MPKKSRNMISFIRLIALLIALLTFYLCLNQKIDITISIFRSLVVYAGFQIIALLGYDLYLILLRKAMLNFKGKKKLSQKYQGKMTENTDMLENNSQEEAVK